MKTTPAKATSATRKKRATAQERFLASYRKTGNIAASAQTARCNRKTVYRWRQDEAFAEAMDEAADDYVDTLEKEADRRGVEGVDEPVFYKGHRVAKVRKYSDTLLMFRLNGLRPEKYKRIERHEHTGKDGEPIATKTEVNLKDLSDDELRAYRELVAAAQSRRA
jgi:hypothetical protein